MRKLHSSVDSSQLRITQYFPLLNKVQQLIKENEKLSEILESFLRTKNLLVNNLTEDKVDEQKNHFLPKIYESAERNTAGQKGNRYDNALSLFCCYLFTIGGRMMYETLAANLPIPTVDSVCKLMNKNVCEIREGVCRFKALKTFLVSRGLPHVVWLSEDATRITERVQYDATTNELVGFVLPLSSNGLPKSGEFVVRSAAEIEKRFLTGKTASLVYAIMAQPLQHNAPTFCLCLFGTDNKFNSEHVRERWKFIVTGLKDEGISVLGVGFDGDPRLLRAMRMETELNGDQSTYYDSSGKRKTLSYFHASFQPRTLCVQDIIHFGAKMRVRLLKYSSLLPMGNNLISSTHLRILINDHPKDKHLLTEKDLSLKDKMNYISVQKICDARVIDMLQQKVPGSDGTILYLKVIHLFTSAFLNEDLSPEQRMYNSWYCIFFMRFWRAWLSQNLHYSITDNFISLNTYLCMELNAHSLVNIIWKLREYHEQNLGTSYVFLPWLMSSQACQSFFRRLRSMSTTYSTVVNCTLLEAIHRVKRMQLQADITSGNVNNCTNIFHYPRIASSKPIVEQFELPDFDIMQKTIDRAKQEAFIKVKRLGIDIKISDCIKISVKCLDIGESKVAELHNTEIAEEECMNEHSLDETSVDLLQDLNVLKTVEGYWELTNYKNSVNLNPEGPFVPVKDGMGKEMIVRKSSICWLLSNGHSKLSSDRLQRVRDQEVIKYASRRNLTSHETDNRVFIKKCAEINIGEWCLFEEKDYETSLLGLIVNFAYAGGKTLKSREFSGSYARIEGNQREISVLCSWYIMEKGSDTLLPQPMTVQGYIDIKRYQKTISPPTFDDRGNLKIDQNILQ